MSEPAPFEPHEHPNSPVSAAQNTVQAAVTLARAEAAVVLAHARQLAVGSVIAVVLAVITGFMLQSALALVVVAPLIHAESDLETRTLVLLLAIPVLAAAAAAFSTYVAVKRVLRLARAQNLDEPNFGGGRDEPHIVGA